MSMPSLLPSATPARAVVFAYHNVGVRCLSVLLAAGVQVALVVTHEDDPGEQVWFGSVAELARMHGIPVITPEDPNSPDVVAQVSALRADFLFSFYYRRMLGEALLGSVTRGALNMHGSLLPRYRGRVPVNWAVIRGEHETGASLHYMTAKPDQGAIAGRQRVPILPDDTAYEVFQKVTWAAELVLEQTLPGLLDGSNVAQAQNLAEGNYCAGRKPADGRIDWSRPLPEIHNLVRGVAPPYPGAFTELGGLTARILRTQLIPGNPAQASGAVMRRPELIADGRRGLWVETGEAVRLRILSMELDGVAVTPADVRARLGGSYLLPS